MREMTLREVQLVSLEILKDVHQFCVENGISYSLSGGTLLGAIRHNGFIPWDDDLDIQMPYPDYYRFIHSFKSQKGYKLFSRELDGCGNVMMRMGRVCEMERTFVDQGPYPWLKGETGIWIDIIPVYGAPDNEREMHKHYRKVQLYGRISNCWRIKHVPWGYVWRYKSKYRRFTFFLKKPLGYFLTGKAMDNYINELKKYDYTTSEYMFAGPQNGMGEWQPKRNMNKMRLHPFEDAEFYIMSEYDANLKGLYGNYMQMPPVNSRISHSFFKYYWR